MQVEVKVCGELHVVFVGGDDEAVGAGVCGPASSEVCAAVSDACEEESDVAFFLRFVAGEEVVFRGADVGG